MYARACRIDLSFPLKQIESLSGARAGTGFRDSRNLAMAGPEFAGTVRP
jgi:hypothetical protein